jgi:hypothetical protein
VTDVPSAKILAFGPGKFPFAFMVDEWRELQRTTKAGPWEIEKRLLAGSCTRDEIAEVLRVGLWGGGLPAIEAEALVEAYVGRKPGDMGPARLVGLAALGHWLHGVDEDLVGELSPPAPKGVRKSRRRAAKSPGSTS